MHAGPVVGYIRVSTEQQADQSVSPDGDIRYGQIMVQCRLAWTEHAILQWGLIHANI